MSALRYIRLPNPARNKENRAIAGEEARGIDCDAVYITRNRFRSSPQAASGVGSIAADMGSHELHPYLRQSRPTGWSWGKIRRSVRAAFQRAE